MQEALLEEFKECFPNKALLSVEDICALLTCGEETVYSWTKRTDAKRRPPRIIVGREVRFPRTAFLKWLVTEQSGV